MGISFVIPQPFHLWNRKFQSELCTLWYDFGERCCCRCWTDLFVVVIVIAQLTWWGWPVQDLTSRGLQRVWSLTEKRTCSSYLYMLYRMAYSDFSCRDTQQSECCHVTAWSVGYTVHVEHQGHGWVVSVLAFQVLSVGGGNFVFSRLLLINILWRLLCQLPCKKNILVTG